MQRLELLDLHALRTLGSTIWWDSKKRETKRKQLVRFIDWLSDQLESLPFSHPLRLLIFEHGPYHMCASAPEDWHRLDDVVHAKELIRVQVNLGEHAEDCGCRSVLTSAFPRSNGAGLLCFG